MIPARLSRCSSSLLPASSCHSKLPAPALALLVSPGYQPCRCQGPGGLLTEFAPAAAVLSGTYSQGLVLLCAEDLPEKTQDCQDRPSDEDVLLTELDGVLKFPGRKRRR